MVSRVQEKLDFKGITRLRGFPTLEQITEVWENNKSVVCCYIPSELEQYAINIIIVKDADTTDIHNFNFIDINGDIISQFQKIANYNNVDIGDHRKNSSGLNGTPSISDCAYCGYIKQNFFDKKINMSRIVYKSDNFFVIPTLGQFINGYLLIIPISHIMSNAELDSSLREEFLTVLDDITYILELTYHTSNFLVWENGTGNSGIGKAKDSVVHAHTHIAPSKLSASEIETISKFSFDKIPYEYLSLYGNHSYLLIKGIGDNWLINDNPELYIPRQYVRQLLAEEYNISGESWNWRIYPFLNSIIQTIVDITTALNEHWDELPERIKKNTKNFLYQK